MTKVAIHAGKRERKEGYQGGASRTFKLRTADLRESERKKEKNTDKHKGKTKQKSRLQQPVKR